MSRAAAATALEDVEKTRQIGVQIGMRVLQRIAHACLRGEVNHAGKSSAAEQPFSCRTVGEIEALKGEPGALLQLRQPCLLQGRIIVGIDAVDADDGPAGLEQPARQAKPDEARRSGDEDGLIRHDRDIGMMNLKRGVRY